PPGSLLPGNLLHKRLTVYKSSFLSSGKPELMKAKASFRTPKGNFATGTNYFISTAAARVKQVKKKMKRICLINRIRRCPDLHKQTARINLKLEKIPAGEV
ncbi:MAG: hypothetical protein R6V10_12830, partial [bacterium]